ncbi:MAG TPA: substrate-binding domain-containing protein [Pilimelia sp.]|nr:substrate-binding domain-containing protein [Pilimelia sp.]
MRRRTLAIAAATVLATGVLAGCGGPAGTDAGPAAAEVPRVGVILPDSSAGARWESADRRYLTEAFRSAGVEYDIRNAQGDKAQFRSLADDMLADGVDVLMIVSLDPATGRAVLDQAKAKGVATVDYDRLTVGGSASYHVSFDSERAGRLQGEGLVRCLKTADDAKPVVAYLNGAPGDHSAVLLRRGYDAVLRPRFAAGELAKGPERSVPAWDPARARSLFTQMLAQADGDIDGVLSANDDLGAAALSVLRKRSLDDVPVTGQDASLAGLRNVLAGQQCVTVYKAIGRLARAAADVAVALARGEKADPARFLRDPQSGRQVPAVLLEPRAITKANLKVVVDDGLVTPGDLCGGDFAELCKTAGITPP